MATIPRAALDYLSSEVNAISAEAQARVLRVLSSISWTPDDVASCREIVLQALAQVLPAYTDMAAQASADFYDASRELCVGEAMGAQAISGYDPSRTDASIRALVQTIVDGKPIEKFNDQVLERVDYEMKRSAGNCMIENGLRDPAGPRFARVPTGAETCEFCLMLASRGFVYHSKESAGALNHYHANCDCRIVASFEADTVQGYDPDDLYLKWKHPEEWERKHAGEHPDPADHAEPERRFVYEPAKNKRSALEYLRTMGFEKVSGALTLDELNMLSRSFTDLFNEFPFMVGQIPEIKTGKMSACAYFSVSSSYDRNTGGRSFSDFFKFDRSSIDSIEETSRAMCRRNADGVRWWTQKQGIDGLVRHEFTHAVEYRMALGRHGVSYGDTVDLRTASAAWSEIKRRSVSEGVVSEAFGNLGIEYNSRNVSRLISKYGATNSSEALAEAVSCEDGDDAICNEVKRVLRKRIEEAGLS